MQSGKNVDNKKNLKKLVAPCCSYGHKPGSMYVSSNITINKIVDNVAIKKYGSTLQSKYRNMWPSYNSRLLLSVKPKSFSFNWSVNITVPGILPSIQTHAALQTSRQNLHVVRQLVWALYTIYILLKSSRHSSWVIGKLH